VVLVASAMHGVMRHDIHAMLCCAERDLTSAEQSCRTVCENAQAASQLCPALRNLGQAQHSTAQHSTAQHDTAQHSTGIVPEHFKSYFSFIGSLTGSHNSGEGELIRPGAALHHALSQAYSLPKLCTHHHKCLSVGIRQACSSVHHAKPQLH